MTEQDTQVIDDIEVRSSDIPMNVSEQIQDKLSALCIEERKRLLEHVNANIKPLRLQLPCELDCHSCNIAKVIECFYLDNKQRFGGLTLDKNKSNVVKKIDFIEEIEIRQQVVHKINNILEFIVSNIVK